MKTDAGANQVEPNDGFECPLFPELKPSSLGKVRTYKRINHPIWTEHKAKFIQQYLKLFVQVTKHGAYIDGFSGPQYPDRLDAWAAALVLESEPKWLQRFFLCEKSQTKLKFVNELIAAQEIPRDRKGRKLPRKIQVYPGDFNLNVSKILESGEITQKEATFCLLDQHTFECKWSTLKLLAEYKRPPNNKIELLYFLCVGWLHRALSGVKKKETIERVEQWWGNKDWRNLLKMNEYSITESARERLQHELGYRHTAAFPIYDRKKSNRIMYYMIHASDHPEAPALMVRAHQKAVRSLPKEIQRPLDFVKSEPNS
jgi:three-Cys-motif partner protein